MNTYLVLLGKEEGQQTWTLMDASSLREDPGKDLIRCRFTGEMMRVVMRFQAPCWDGAQTIFDWKARFDRKVPKDVLSWEEAKLLLEPHVHQASQEPPRPREVRLHREDPGGRPGREVLAQGQEQQTDRPRPDLRVLRAPSGTGDPQSA